MEKNLELIEKIEEKLTPDILLAMVEIQQPRSRFQLDKFVVNQHDTDEMRYFQTVIELQNIYYTIRETGLEIKKMEIEIKRLRATGDEIDEIEAQKKELNLERIRLVAIGAFREADHLVTIFNNFTKKYTREEIEQAQPDYWMKRLNRQAVLASISNDAASAGHLDSLRQIGILSVEGNEIKTIELEKPNELL